MRCYAAVAVSVDTLYVGGGTPSVLSPTEIEKIKSAIVSVFNSASSVLGYN